MQQQPQKALDATSLDKLCAPIKNAATDNRYNILVSLSMTQSTSNYYQKNDKGITKYSKRTGT